MGPTKEILLDRFRNNAMHTVSDLVAVEEPLEIQLKYGENLVTANVSITMRTPGNDQELSYGFLFTEGIVRSSSDIAGFLQLGNVAMITLNPEVKVRLGSLSRNFYTTSSCGVCGKASIDALKAVTPADYPNRDWKIDARLIGSFPNILRKQQAVFERTGGLHAAALFDTTGKLVSLREDVGRHNALDKLIGLCLMSDSIPVADSVLLLSGRASFELIQKAAMAGIQCIAAVGAPSNLAVETASEFGISLIGFLSESSFNIYCGSHRVEHL